MAPPKPPGFSTQAWKWCAAWATLLAIAALLPPTGTRVLLLFVAAGLGPLPALRRHWPASEALFAMPTLSIVLWSISAVIAWEAQLPDMLVWIPPLLIACLAFFLRQAGRFAIQAGRIDVVALSITLVLALPAFAVYLKNGPQWVPAGLQYEARGWVGHDSFYFFSLAQQAADRQGYPDESPFLARTPNLYPSLFHCGVGALSSLGGGLAAIIGWHLFLPVVLSGMGLLFHVARRQYTRCRRSPALWTAALTTLVFFLLRPDQQMFPQTHIFGFAVLMLSWLYLMPLWRGNRRAVAISITIACVLAAGHAVHAAAAIVMLLATAGTLIIQRKKRPALYCATGAALAGLIFLLMNQTLHGGLMGFNMPADLVWFRVKEFVFPYLVPTLIALAPIFLRQTRRQPAAWAAGGLAAAAIFYCAQSFFKSTPIEQIFGVNNAPRFVLLALIPALPLLARWKARAPITALAVLGVHALVYPNSFALDSPGMLRADPYLVPPKVMEMYARIRANYNPNTAIATNVPGFDAATLTGRPQFGNELSPYYSYGSYKQDDLARRLRVNQLLFAGKDPQYCLDVLRAYGVNLIIARRSLSPDGKGLNPADLAILPPGSFHVLAEYPLGLIQILPDPDPAKRPR